MDDARYISASTRGPLIAKVTQHVYSVEKRDGVPLISVCILRDSTCNHTCMCSHEPVADAASLRENGKVCLNHLADLSLVCSVCNRARRMLGCGLISVVGSHGRATVHPEPRSRIFHMGWRLVIQYFFSLCALKTANYTKDCLHKSRQPRCKNLLRVAGIELNV